MTGPTVHLTPSMFARLNRSPSFPTSTLPRPAGGALGLTASPVLDGYGYPLTEKENAAPLEGSLENLFLPGVEVTVNSGAGQRYTVSRTLRGGRIGDRDRVLYLVGEA